MQKKNFVVIENEYGVQVENANAEWMDSAKIKVVDAEEYPQKIFLKNGNVKVLDTHMNLEWLLSHFNVSIKFNLMSKDVEINIPGHEFSKEDKQNNQLHFITYLATINKMPIKQIDKHIDALALQNAYHPIVECIKDNSWDGTTRIDDFIQTIESDLPIANKIIKTWMVAAIAAVFSKDGFVNQGVLVLQGEQGVGKTTWVESLNPIEQEAIKLGAILNPNDKDSVFQLSQFWISELGEVECTFKRSEMGRLKSFVTMKKDFLRLPYARKSTEIPRRSVYVATVNDANYLTDDTGNRRWWTIPVKKINFKHDFDMRQVWAEVYNLYLNNHPTSLDEDTQSQLNENNKQHARIDPLKEKTILFYDWSHPPRRYMTTTQILEEMGFDKPTFGEVKRMGSILKEINNKDAFKTNGIHKHAVPTRRMP